jgi:hypothetical protein
MSYLMHWKGEKWWAVCWRQWGLLISLTPSRGALILGPFLAGYGVFPAQGFWLIRPWLNLRFLNVPTIGGAVSINHHEVTISLGFLLFMLKIDVGDWQSVPEWVQYLGKMSSFRSENERK